jgi:hypothetical protein
LPHLQMAFIQRSRRLLVNVADLSREGQLFVSFYVLVR